MEKIRILGVAPYEGMSVLMQKVALSYPQIELNVVLGDMQKGAEVALQNFHSSYDMLISRGGTAQLLKKHLPLPVIDIPISEYDILRALRLAQNFSAKHAVVGFPNVTSNINLLADLLSASLHPFTVYEESQVTEVLKKAVEEGFQSILCDTIVSVTAKEMGLNAILITSGAESIKKAFDDVLSLGDNLDSFRTENLFLRRLLSGQASETIAFDQNKNLYFSSAKEKIPLDVLDMFRSEIDNCSDAPTRISKSLNGSLYNVKGHRFSVDDKDYTAFYFSRGKTPLISTRHGLKYYTKQEALTEFYDEFYSITGVFSPLEEELLMLNESQRPIMLIGEIGSGKEPATALLYANSSISHHPLVTIDCHLLNEKTWNFLETSHNSPFADSEITISIANIDKLTEEKRQLLMSLLDGMNVCQRNKVIFSCISGVDGKIPQSSLEFLDAFRCLKFYMPPLREQAKKIPAFASMYINQLNTSQTIEILGLDAEGLTLLQNFSWSHNYSQFKRVLHELITKTTEPVIASSLVRQVLKTEFASPVIEVSADAAERFNLNRTLDEMNREIIMRVLKECDGNQSAAAERLGISRTTLWRFLKK